MTTPRVVERFRQSAVCLLLVVMAFHQSAGLISNDTKIDLTADPGRFLLRALDLWNPSSAGGQLQNQAYGYLFPMGLFHLLGYWLGLPGWVVQRSWMSLLLVVSFLGVLRLAARLELGTPTTRLLGGLAFALAPRVLTELGGNSSEILPVAVLPWVLIPLVGGERRPRTAAMRSGVAILCMGAVNATAVLALLPLPALWLVPGLRRAAGRRLAAWWVLAGALACMWWFVPLLLQGRYSPDFLNYIETAATTTSTTSPAEVLRGTSHWLGYVAVGGQPWWQSGWTLVTSAVAIVNTGVISALCVVGLVRRRMPHQGRLVLVAALGLLAMSAAHAGPLHGPLDGTLRTLLDGSLAPFRNVHKFDALLRLPLALGLCHLLSLVPQRKVITAVVAVGLIGSATPALAGQVVPAGAYEKLPSWWTSTGHYLDQHDSRGRALVVPASGFGEYLWGRPLDNPLQALTTTPWVVRDAVPLGSAGTTRLLDAIETRLDTGQGSAALAQVLARSGVHYLVISNDLDPALTGAPRPVLVHQALATSPGLTRVAGFGPKVGGDGKRALVSDDGLSVAYSAVEVYEVAGTESPATSMATAATWVISGGPESLFQLADRGLLGNQATVLAGDASGGPSPRSAVTDALRRREVNFGSVRDNSSATLTAEGPLTRAQPVPDELPVPGLQHLSVAQVVGADAVSASTSASDASAVLDRGPDKQPFSAFDGDPSTAWVTGSLGGAQGQWVSLALSSPTDPSGTTLQLFQDASVKGIVRVVTVTTDTGSRRTALASDQAAQPVNVPPGVTRHLRVTLTSVAHDGYGVLAGLREITIPGVTVQQTIALPSDQSLSADPVILLDRAPGARSACVSTSDRAICSPDLLRAGEDVVRLDRTFTLASAQSLAISGSAVAVPGPGLDALLDKGSALQVAASSSLTADPRERPSTVVDGDVTTGWIAGQDDRSPSLTVSWTGRRAVSQVDLFTSANLAAARPTKVLVNGLSLTVPDTGVLSFPSVVTDHVTLRFTSWEKRVSFSLDGSSHRLPVGISEITIPALPLSTSPQGGVRFSLPCGSGPPVVVDGEAHLSAVLGTRDDLLTGQPMLLNLCGFGGLNLAPGTHRVVAASSSSVQVEGLTLGDPLPSAAVVPRTTTVRRWDSEHRTVLVGSGQESYLVVHENANRGWRAVLDGKVLTPTRIDGWQQAWIVPAGAGGVVHLDFTPGRTFHLALLIGLLLVLLLLGLALVPARLREPSAAPDLDLPVPVRVVLGLGFMVLLGGLTGGLLFLAALVFRRFLNDERASGAYATALIGAALLTALRPWNGVHPPAAFGEPVQVLVLIGLAAVAASVAWPHRDPA